MNPTAFTTRLLPRVLTAGGAVGLSAAFVLTVEKIALLKNPDYIPTCSIDPILSCGSIMRTAQAEVFGFPNPLLGIVGFTVVVTTGVVVLAGGALPRWFWPALQGGTLLGVVFVHWLVYNLYEGHLAAPRRLTVLVTGYHGVVLTVWYAAIVLLVLRAFWSYWLGLL